MVHIFDIIGRPKEITLGERIVKYTSTPYYGNREDKGMNMRIKRKTRLSQMLTQMEKLQNKSVSFYRTYQTRNEREMDALIDKANDLCLYWEIKTSEPRYCFEHSFDGKKQWKVVKENTDKYGSLCEDYDSEYCTDLHTIIERECWIEYLRVFGKIR